MHITLAPMEGVVDHLMRDMLTQVGGFDLCVTEFVRVVDQLMPKRVFHRICPELNNQGFTPNGVPVKVQLLVLCLDHHHHTECTPQRWSDFGFATPWCGAGGPLFAVHLAVDRRRLRLASLLRLLLLQSSADQRRRADSFGRDHQRQAQCVFANGTAVDELQSELLRHRIGCVWQHGRVHAGSDGAPEAGGGHARVDECGEHLAGLHTGLDRVGGGYKIFY